MAGRLENKVAIVTGAASRDEGTGNGKAIALLFAREGARVVLVNRSQERADGLCQEIIDQGGVAIAVAGDMTCATDTEAVVAAAESTYGRLDILCNNIGIGAPGKIADVTEAQWNEVIDTNLKSVMLCTRAAIPAMQRANGGSVINISSISAEFVSVNRGDYCLTKAATGMATKLWATRLAEFGIPVYEVQPGVIKSDMTSGVTEKYDRLIAEGLTLEPRWGKAQDVGKAVSALVRGDIPYATGQVLYVDGGMRIRRL